MNRLAEETANDQVKRELSNAQCLMNDTADDGRPPAAGHEGRDYDGTGGSLAPGAAAGGAGGGGGRHGTDETGMDARVGQATDGGQSADGNDEYNKPFDESQLTKVSVLNENTCPGKEQPLVDGTPDVAQNSGRVVFEAKSGGARAPAAAVLPAVASAALVLALRSRRRC